MANQARPLVDIASFDALPSVSVLRSRPIASFRSGGSIWEIGWNGVWVKSWARLAPVPASRGLKRPFNADHARATGL